MSQAVCESARHQHECYIVAVEAHVVPSPGKILDACIHIVAVDRWTLKRRVEVRKALAHHIVGIAGVGNVVDQGGMR